MVQCHLRIVLLDQLLYVKNSIRSIFYLLIIPMDQQRPVCMTATAKYAAFQLNQIKLTDNVFAISVMYYDAAGQIWPLN